MSDYQTIGRSTSSKMSISKPSKFNIYNVQDRYTAVGQAPPTNYIGCYNNTLTPTVVDNLSVSQCNDLATSNSSPYFETTVENNVKKCKYFPNSAMSNLSNIKQLVAGTNINVNIMGTNMVVGQTSGSSSYTNTCAVPDALSGEYYGNGTSNAVYSSRYIADCEGNNNQTLTCPFGQTVSNGTLKMGRWDSTWCPGQGVSTSTPIISIPYNITPGTKNFVLGDYVKTDVYPNVYKQYSINYNCS